MGAKNHSRIKSPVRRPADEDIDHHPPQSTARYPMRLPEMGLPTRANRLIAAAFAAGFVAVIASLVGSSTAVADPYRWCALYGGDASGGTNCGFVTLEQCRAAVSGVGGFCNVNLFYDGVPFDDGRPSIKPRRLRR
jgi:Protein of unknown function (DUF3551)